MACRRWRARSSAPPPSASSSPSLRCCAAKPCTCPVRRWRSFAVQCVATLVISVGYLASVQFIPVGLAVIIFFSFPVLIMLAAPLVEGSFAGAGAHRASPSSPSPGLAVAMGPSFDDLDIRGHPAGGRRRCGRRAAVLFRPLHLRYMTPAVFGSLVHLAILPATLLVALYAGDGVTLQILPGGTATASGACSSCRALAAVYVVAYMVHMLSLRFAPASTVAPFYNLEPVVTTLVAAVLLGERLQPEPICRAAAWFWPLCRIEPARKPEDHTTMNNAPIPVAILTGFLGAGKTTLLNFAAEGSLPRPTPPSSSTSSAISASIICWSNAPTRMSSRWPRAACAAPSAAI